MAGWRVTHDPFGSNIWDGDRPIGTVNKDVADRMAAAQDLLAALEHLLLDYEDEWGSELVDDFYADVRAALAKAKGE